MKDEDGNIGIGEWAEEVVADICRFADHWNAQRELGDPAYPERMGKGDWDEQFNFYTSNAPVSGGGTPSAGLAGYPGDRT